MSDFSLDSTPRRSRRIDPDTTYQPHLFDVGEDWLPGQTELFPEKPRGFAIVVDGVTQWYPKDSILPLPADCFILREDEDDYLCLTPAKYADRGAFVFATHRTIRHGASDCWGDVEFLGIGNFRVKFRELDRCALVYLAEGTKFQTGSDQDIVWEVSDHRDAMGNVGCYGSGGIKKLFHPLMICVPACPDYTQDEIDLYGPRIKGE